MDGEDVYRARLAACLAAAEIATLPQVRKRHLAAARQWQTLLDNALELRVLSLHRAPRPEFAPQLVLLSIKGAPETGSRVRRSRNILACQHSELCSPGRCFDRFSEGLDVLEPTVALAEHLRQPLEGESRQRRLVRIDDGDR